MYYSKLQLAALLTFCEFVTIWLPLFGQEFYYLYNIQYGDTHTLPLYVNWNLKQQNPPSFTFVLL